MLFPSGNTDSTTNVPAKEQEMGLPSFCFTLIPSCTYLLRADLILATIRGNYNAMATPKLKCIIVENCIILLGNFTKKIWVLSLHVQCMYFKFFITRKLSAMKFSIKFVKFPQQDAC